MTIAFPLDNHPLVSISVPSTFDAGRQVRRAVAPALSYLRPVQRADVSMLMSELVVAMAGEGDSSDSVTVDVRLGDHTIEVSVLGPGDGELDPMVASVFDRLAVDWRSEAGAAWFRLDLSPLIPDGTRDERVLFERVEKGDAMARDALFDRYQPFASSLTRRFRHVGMAPEDLEQVAAVALVKALDRFDTSRQVKFTTFAARTIEGELKRHLRDHGWSLRVPRGLQEAGMAARRAEASLSQRLARPPTLEELADETDLDIDTVGDALVAWSSFDWMSLDAPPGGAEEGLAPLDRLPDQDAVLERTPDRADLLGAVRDLSDRDRLILHLRFFEDLSQSEIAAQVGVSQMHVSRLLAASLETLRLRLGGIPRD